MTEDQLHILLHNLRGELTVIKTEVSFILEGRTGELAPQTKDFLEQTLDRTEKAIQLTFVKREGEQHG
jgi:hypothetical protein